MINHSLMTDFYEITMSKTYFDQGMKDDYVYFDVFFRENPFNGGYTISGGLDNIIKFINNFHYDKEDIDYLKSLNKFDDDFLNYLSNIKFTGDIYMVPDGTMVFPGEPVLTIRAKVIEAQLLETALLTCFNASSLVITKAKRITNEAGNIQVMEFGARRARSIEAAIEASKDAYIGGCIGTSNTEAGKKYKIPVLGTMAHSLITSSESEYDAFKNFAKSNPDSCVFLVDTYDTLKEGIPNAIKVANEYLKPNGIKFKGIRIDSGDLSYLSKEARKMLDNAGYRDAIICLSNGLDEYSVASLLKEGACIDSLGIGDNIAASNDRVGGVYKLVAIEKDNKILPRIKVSDDTVKTITPGYKMVYRFYDNDTGYAIGDLLALYDEEIPLDHYTLIHPIDTWKKKEITNYHVRQLQVPIYKDGVLVYQEPTLEEKKAYCDREFKSFYPEITRLYNPHNYYVDLSKDLLDLKNKMINEHQERNDDNV